MTEPVWLDKDLILALYEDIVAATGGAVGVRDEGLLESPWRGHGIDLPMNRWATCWSSQRRTP